MNDSAQRGFSMKAVFFAFFSSLAILALLFLNFYSHVISTYIPFATPLYIFVFSVLSSVALGVYFFNREHDFQVLKYEFVNIVTHKFRTPLTYVTWSVENLKKNQTQEERLESVRQIENAAARLIEMTDILINMAQISEGYAYVFRAESFREIVEKILVEYAPKLREKDIKFNIVMAQDLPLISVDVKRMELVVRVLLENALHYTPKGGMIEIIVKLKGRSAIQFSIADSGIGLSSYERRHIFNVFYRSRAATAADTEGMGVGLFIAKNIVQRHGGHIDVKSAGANKGTVFTFDLPLHHGVK